jgi:hypothetical protein
MPATGKVGASSDEGTWEWGRWGHGVRGKPAQASGEVGASDQNRTFDRNFSVEGGGLDRNWLTIWFCGSNVLRLIGTGLAME